LTGESQSLFILYGSEGIGKTTLIAKAVREAMPKFIPDISYVLWHKFTQEKKSGLDTLLLKFRSFFKTYEDENPVKRLENPKTRIEDKINEVILALSKKKYYLVFDDLHVLLGQDKKICDPGLHLLFERLASDDLKSKVIVVSRVHPEFTKSKAYIKAEEMTELLEEASIALMEKLGYAGNDVALPRQVYERTGGNLEAIRLLYGLREKPSLKQVLEDVGKEREDFLGIFQKSPKVVNSYVSHREARHI
jgi:hypothetical protein